ncbi:MAG TPA: S8 family serine peptidase [Steroidobacteraceae bacterium]|nr:S8 family serine peptidase [Steroidobacteraceae bacterium]
MTTPIRVPATIAALVAIATLAPAQAATAPKPDDPTSFLAAIKQAPDAKLGPWLANLAAEYRAARDKGVTDTRFRTKNRALRTSRGTVAIDAVANNPAALVRSLKAMGAVSVTAKGPLVAARVPISALGRLAAEPSLRYARPVMATKDALPANAVSQGVVSLRADVGREQAGVDGSGIKVGVLSDSIGCNPPPFLPGTRTTTLQEDINTGELPTEVQILKDAVCPATDEGRGMAQLIHDTAPGAAIAFHTAFESELDFAEGIIRLQENAGSDVIVDDVRYFAEPFFMDGMIAQAVDIVARRGVPYFSSAGNQARNSYESAYRPVNQAINASGNVTGAPNRVSRMHDFDPGPGVQVLQPVAVVPDADAGFIIFSFQWDQPHRTATTYAWIKEGKSAAEASQLAKGAASDLDLVIFDHKGHLLRRCPPGVSTGITCQITGDSNVGGDAVDLAAIFYSGPPKAPQLFYIAFVHSAGPDPGVVKYSWFDSQGAMVPLDFHTASGTSFGHSNAAGNIAVGAAAWYATVPFSTSGNYPPNDIYFTPKIAPGLAVCAPACLNDFSSAGGIPIYFDRFGNRLAAPEVREVPAVTGPDGGNTSFFTTDSTYDDDDGDGLNSPFSTFVTPQLDSGLDEFPNFFGTSASAPHVAAVAALLLDKTASLTPEQVREVLQKTARGPIDKRFTSNRPIIITPIEVGGYNFDAGTGLVDAAAALDAAD